MSRKLEKAYIVTVTLPSGWKHVTTHWAESVEEVRKKVRRVESNAKEIEVEELT